MSTEINPEENGKVNYKNPQHNIKVEKFRNIICLPFYIEKKSCPVGVKSEVSLAEIKDLLDKSGEWEVFDKLPKSDDDAYEKARKYQARAYFHPFVQRFLYDENRLMRYRRKKKCDGKLQLHVQLILGDYGHEYIQELTLTIESCEISLFMPNIGIFMIKINHDKSIPLNIAQKILDELRRVYPPYFNERKEVNFVKTTGLKIIEPDNLTAWQKTNGKMSLWQSGHCPISVKLIKDNNICNAENKFYSFNEEYQLSELIEKNAKYFENSSNQGLVHPWAAHWSELLKPFSTDNNGQGLVIKQFGDDRAATISYLAVDELKSINRGNWVRLCFSDEPGNDRLPYSATFLQNFEAQYCYDRYWYKGATIDGTDWPSRILNCGYSFSYIGSNQCSFFTSDKNGALATFNYIYTDMGMIAHFQRAALLSFSQRLSELLKRDKKNGKIKFPDNDEVQKMYREFIEFTQNYWFDEISPQEQGQQLFLMWRKHLRIQELYDEVRQELKDLVEYIELQETKNAEIASSNLNINVFIFGLFGLVVAFISAIAGVFGINDLKDGDKTRVLKIFDSHKLIDSLSNFKNEFNFNLHIMQDNFLSILVVLFIAPIFIILIIWIIGLFRKK